MYVCKHSLVSGHANTLESLSISSTCFDSDWRHRLQGPSGCTCSVFWTLWIVHVKVDHARRNTSPHQNTERRMQNSTAKEYSHNFAITEPTWQELTLYLQRIAPNIEAPSSRNPKRQPLLFWRASISKQLGQGDLFWLLIYFLEFLNDLDL